MNKEEFKTQVLVFLDQPDTEFLHDKAQDTNEVAVLMIYLKKAKRIFATNISDADTLMNQANNLQNAE
jgi:hypothetical protein